VSGRFPKTDVLNMKKFIIFLNLILITFFAYANNLRISEGTIISSDSSSGTAKVQFSLSWQNSWRDFSNYDAVWIFLKYSTGKGDGWRHLTLAASGANPFGFSAGSGTSVEIIVPSDRKGCFIQRTVSGSGTVNGEDIQLNWDYNYDGITEEELKFIDIKIMGMEMVYVPQGSFYAGDGTEEAAGAQFAQGSVSAKDNPWYIESENAIKVRGIDSDGYYYNSAENAGEDESGSEFIISSSFPKGYHDFYIMKYEITQGQYANFLNTITAAQALNRYPDKNGQNRHTITETDGNYSTSCSDRAANYLSWQDLCAFADWAALRPVTELEFEKAARGKDIYPEAGELPWGSTLITPALSIVGSEDGTETIANNEANCNYGDHSLSGGDAGTGPVRAGIFAVSDSNRQQSGGSYYGVMEMAGNVWERAVTVGNSAGRSFQGTQGDGALTAVSGFEGNADNSDWPGFTDGEGVSGASGSGFRGGSWLTLAEEELSISNRSEAASADSSRKSDAGGRCGRRPY
jgi:formylglycine-generating enzyme required for sulfatase activity